MKMIHHPYCTKSVAALEFLKQNTIEVEIIDITAQKPDRPMLLDLLLKLGLKPFDLVRTTEKIFQAKFEGKILSDDEWIEALIKHPILIQRPIFIEGERAVIGRPAEKIFDLNPTKKG